MLSLLVPALINVLIDTELTKYDNNVSKYRCKLHEFSLQCLLKIGPVYPQVFSIFTTVYNKCIFYNCYFFRNLKLLCLKIIN
jgi:hypothetical protein